MFSQSFCRSLSSEFPVRSSKNQPKNIGVSFHCYSIPVYSKRGVIIKIHWEDKVEVEGRRGGSWGKMRWMLREDEVEVEGRWAGGWGKMRCFLPSDECIKRRNISRVVFTLLQHEANNGRQVLAGGCKLSVHLLGKLAHNQVRNSNLSFQRSISTTTQKNKLSNGPQHRWSPTQMVPNTNGPHV